MSTCDPGGFPLLSRRTGLMVLMLVYLTLAFLLYQVFAPLAGSLTGSEGTTSITAQGYLRDSDGVSVPWRAFTVSYGDNGLTCIWVSHTGMSCNWQAWNAGIPSHGPE